MNALVVYDSKFGNTAAVAEAIGNALKGAGGSCEVWSVSEADLDRVLTFDLLVVGSPTQGGRPTAAIARLLKALPPYRLEHMPVATFDTRVDARREGLALRLLMKVLGYAAPRIATELVRKGATLLAPPEAFYVDGNEGPLGEGELARAASWAAAAFATSGSRASAAPAGTP